MPEAKDDVRFIAAPSHNVVGVAVAVTPVGNGLMETLTVETKELHPLAVAVKLYTPDVAAVALVIVGFCKDEVNPFGPVHENVVPILVVPVKFNAVPAHIGLLLPAVAVGTGLIFTVAILE